MSGNHPHGIQRLRKKGWRLPAGTVCVTRGTRWGNPWSVERVNKALHGAVNFSAIKSDNLWFAAFDERDDCLPRHLTFGTLAAEVAVKMFRAMGEAFRMRDPEGFAAWIAPLAGHDLACFCPLDAPCHRNVLLDWANLDLELPDWFGADFDGVARGPHLHLPVHFGGPR